MTFTLDPEVAAVVGPAIGQNGPPPAPSVGDIAGRRAALDPMLEYFSNQAQPVAGNIDISDQSMVTPDGAMLLASWYRRPSSDSRAFRAWPKMPNVAEDAWQGDAQFTVAVDGTQIGGVQTATASHAGGQSQLFNVRGSFAAGSHTVTVNFLNDAYGGTAQTDRNLYVTGATIDGTAVGGATLNEYSGGPQSFTFVAPGPS